MMRPSSTSMIDEGTHVADRYRVLRRIGGGGVGDVWLAHDEALDRQVAIKVLREASAADQRRFAAESRAQAPLAHPSIVRVFDAGTHADEPFLVLEYVEGSSLSALVEERAMAVDRVVVIGCQIADALAHAHAHGLIHRDVKPGNVLVGDNGRAYLTDFGIAYRSGSARLTASGAFVGTAGYVAPEQVSGETVTGAADVYSLGLVLLEALTGRQEYTGAPLEAAMARLHRPPHVPDDVPAPLRHLLADMVDDAPHARPSAAQVAARLGELADRLAPADSDDVPAEAVTGVARVDSSVTEPLANTDGMNGHRVPAATARSASTEPRAPTSDEGDDAAGRSRGRQMARRWVAVSLAVLLVGVALVAAATLLPPATEEVGQPGEPESLEEALDRLEETIEP